MMCTNHYFEYRYFTFSNKSKVLCDIQKRVDAR